MIKLKEITPVYTSILVTCNKYEELEKADNSEVIDPEKSKVMVKDYQEVIAVGNQVRLVVSGDIIAINPMKYAKFKQVKQRNSLRQDLESFKEEIVGFDFPIIEVNGKECMLLDERDILYIVNAFEDDGNIPTE